jgi:hypothetical protein
MKQKNVLLGFVIALMPITANAQVTIDDITYRYYDEGDYIANEAWVTGVDKGKENEVVIPATITPDETEYTLAIIDENAFQDCSKIKSVVLPAGILVIREDAFSRCDGLKDLTVMSPQPPRLSSDAFDKTAYSTVTIHVPAEALVAYQTDDAWKNFEAIVAYDSSVLPINEANFPDANFRSYISSAIDVNADGWLSREEMMVVGRIDVHNSEIKSLKGIENFTELNWLTCYKNELTELDLSKNTKLQKVSCHSNKLTSLNVTKCPGIIKLDCSSNKLTAIDVSNNMKLDRLNLVKNKLTSVDISKLAVVRHFYCGANQLTSLDVTNNTELDSLHFDGNQLTTIDISKNTKLVGLNANANQLTSLDVSHNTELRRLWCHTNQLTSIDVSKNTKLTCLSIAVNNISSIDVTMCSHLDSLYCTDAPITSLDVSKNPTLLVLELIDCQLPSLDVSSNTALKILQCPGNLLTTLDLSQNNALELLSCQRNKLTTLTLSPYSSLIEIYCHRNQIAGQAMDNLIASLPNQENGGIALFNTDYIAEEGNVCTTTQVAALKTKGWTAYHLYNDEFVPYPGSEDTAIDGIRLDNSKGGTAYSLSGQRSRNTHKGVVIRNGKKYINK